MQVQNVEFRCGCGTGYCDVTECWNPQFVAVHPGVPPQEDMDTSNSCNYCSGLMVNGRCGMCGEA